MIFKNKTNLRLIKNKSNVKMNDKRIIFDNSKIELDGNVLVADMKEEVLFIASCIKTRKPEKVSGRYDYDIQLNWINVITNNKQEILLSEDVTDILIITKEMYNSLEKEDKDKQIYLDAAKIYLYVKKNGISGTSTSFHTQVDFCFVTANIVNEDEELEV